MNETSFIRKVWAGKKGEGNTSLNPITPRLSMIAALDTNGTVWFCLSHASTDSNVIALFLKHLTDALDVDSPGWCDETVFLWDNAPYHSSSETIKIVNKLGIQVIFSGPYSYSAAPIETLFSGLKLGELNAEGHPTGKR